MGLGTKAAAPGAGNQMMDGEAWGFSKAQFAFFELGRFCYGAGQPAKTFS